MSSSSRFAFAIAVASASFLAASTASAFCRTWTCDPMHAKCPPDPQNPACQGGSATDHPLFWPVRCIGFSLNEAASSQLPGNTPAQKLDVFHRIADLSFAQWQDATCPGGARPSLAYADLGDVSCDKHEYNQPQGSGGVSQGNANILVFRENEWPYVNTANTLALTTLTFNVDSGEIYDADMEINSVKSLVTLTVTDDPAQVKTDLQSVITHEAGHFIGLAHSPNPDAVMFATYDTGSIKRELASDDVAGVCAIYPPARTGLPECDPTPRHGYSTQCAQEVSAPGSCAVSIPGTSKAVYGTIAAAALALASLLARRRR